MLILKIVHTKTTSHSKHFPYSKKRVYWEDYLMRQSPLSTGC